MNSIEGKIKKLEDAVGTVNTLPEKDRVQVITLPYGLDEAQKEKLIQTEQERILSELHAKHGTFCEQGIQWIEVINFSTQKPLEQSEVTR